MKKTGLLIMELMLLSLFLFSCSKQQETKEIVNITPDSPYVYFGQWPQSLKKDDVTIDNTLVNYNGWDCYKGSDNNYYVKETAIIKSEEELKFSDGSIIEDGKEYYFLIEGIKWKILSNDNDTKFLFSENILTSFCFHKGNPRKLNNKTIHPNNYGHSDIRCYLNGLDGTSYGAGNYEGNGFIDKAFSSEEKKLIKRIAVDNSQTSCNVHNEYKKQHNYFICKDTMDKVFLLSLDEISEPCFGFSDYENDRTKSNKNRMKKLTDYSKTLGLYFTNFYGTSSYYLRSPDNYNSNMAEVVSELGCLDFSPYVSSYDGIVPAIVLVNSPVEDEKTDESKADYVIEETKKTDIPVVDYKTAITKEFSLKLDSDIVLGLYDNVTQVKDFNEDDYLITAQWGDSKWCEQSFNDINVTWNDSNIIFRLSTSSPYCSTFRGIRVGDSLSKIKDMYEKDSSIHIFNKEKDMYEKTFNNDNAVFDMFLGDNEISVTARNIKAEEIMKINFILDKDIITKIELLMN